MPACKPKAHKLGQYWSEKTELHGVYIIPFMQANWTYNIHF